ncbi:YebC/PmpR family DNA-binding transcriptional regulator [Candidatus Cardinium hertigii]|uniref:YebC/PmpR family DNA-binding transcriptional regulator n=1 Tax=Candidatus Cardinium hertigii TaxID=247481 RepID=UPI0021A4ACAD|nr:YebC/PmpR family DNA-binding transcriptional regulator [Candidatus Cardinium hertigii]
MFTKLVKEITVAARSGGTEPECNPRLRLALQNAKGANMPKEAMLRAISKGNKSDADDYQEVIYEGYGSKGVAIMVVCMTEKITRTVANVRAIFTKYGGSLEKSGAISFLFDHKGVFTIATADIKHVDDFILALIDSGAETLENDGEYIYATCAIEHFGKLQKQLEKLAVTPIYAGLQYIPYTLVEVHDADLPKLIKLIDALNDHDDVQKVYHNMAIQAGQERFFD